MNFIFEILQNFFKEEITTTIIIIFALLLTNIIQSYGITTVTSKIIDTIKDGNKPDVYYLFKVFMGLSIAYLVINYIFKTFQNKLLTKLWQWIKNELVRLILINNNENFGSKNFISMITPITRIASVCYMIISDLISFVLPILTFLIVIISYFLYHNPMMGILFLVANIIILLYFVVVCRNIMEKDEVYEKTAAKYEFHILEILNNIDRIIYRGQTDQEISKLTELMKDTIKQAYEFYSCTNFHGFVMNSFVYVVIFAVLNSNITAYYDKRLDLVMFITFLSIIILYREKMAIVIQQIQDFIEFFGRMNGVLDTFSEVKNIYKIPYNPSELKFEKLRFENVSFKYDTSDKQVFNNFNLVLNTNDHKIIGVTGISGRGKSTFMKLLLKMYKNYEGDIYIDDKNIKEIDPDYIRANITYVNQNSKLFDKIIIDNMMYGCSNNEACYQHLETIIKKYPKINELFQKMDIYKKRSGPLGENLSGGQRQVVNIISGLINPSKILLLDEPTNALDGELKQNVLDVINEFRNYKQCIIIITHDTSVYSLFNEKIEM